MLATSDVEEACKGVEVAVMVGGFPRKAGMERKDVMSKNVSIYKSQASALEKHAAEGVKVQPPAAIDVQLQFNMHAMHHSRRAGSSDLVTHVPMCNHASGWRAQSTR